MVYKYLTWRTLGKPSVGNILPVFVRGLSHQRVGEVGKRNKAAFTPVVVSMYRKGHV